MNKCSTGRLLVPLTLLGLAVPPSVLPASPFDTEVMYKATCSPRINLFDIDRFVVDYDLGSEYIDSEIRQANRNPRVGIFRLDARTVTHRCKVENRRELVLTRRGQLFSLELDGRSIFRDFYIDPTQTESDDNVFSRVSVNPGSGYIEFCTADKACSRIAMEEPGAAERE